MKITAKVIQHSISHYTGKEIITYELEYPRYIHAEFMTHRLFSRNSASSRAIPVETMHKQIIEQDVTFVHIGRNQPGMQAKEELPEAEKHQILDLWRSARDHCIRAAARMAELGAHKQVVNRVTEPWMMMKVVMTTTDDANWDWLRRHSDAQPEIKALADVMYEAKTASTPMEIYLDEWHVPYVSRYRDETSNILFYGDDGKLSVEDAKKVSASCCAQVSYRKNDDSLEKAKAIFDRLINSEPVHASPVEHQATPIDYDYHFPEGIIFDEVWLAKQGITHQTVRGGLGSGNFQHWIQFRQLIPNNTKW